MNFCTLFLCALRSVIVLLHLCTCFLRIVLGPSFLLRFVQRVVAFLCFFLLLMGDSLIQYRAAIGLYNCFKFVSGFIVFLPPILFVVVLVVLISSLLVQFIQILGPAALIFQSLI